MCSLYYEIGKFPFESGSSSWVLLLLLFFIILAYNIEEMKKVFLTKLTLRIIIGVRPQKRMLHPAKTNFQQPDSWLQSTQTMLRIISNTKIVAKYFKSANAGIQASNTVSAGPCLPESATTSSASALRVFEHDGNIWTMTSS